jgi:enoyl-CoA hydratase/carnithine racemase
MGAGSREGCGRGDIEGTILVTAEPDGAVGDVLVIRHPGYVGEVALNRPPNNFFDVKLIRAVVGAYDDLDADPECRVILLTSVGKHFCAGADFSPKQRTPEEAADEANLYWEAVRLFKNRKPVVAVIHGGAIGGGLGLACSADFRVASPEARFAANFARLGLHHGFGLSVTLPGIVGQQRALDLLYRGRRVGGEEAHQLGLCDVLAPAAELRDAALAFAADIASSGPLAVEAIRLTMRGDLGDRVHAALTHELAVQQKLQATEDFREGIRASAERRPPNFQGR